MPALGNLRHDTFAAMIATGMQPGIAYRAAGYESQGVAASVGAYKLMKRPEIIARVEELRGVAHALLEARVSTAIIDESVTKREGRIRALCERRTWLMRVIADRSVFHDHQDVPGGNTGLVVTDRKTIGKSDKEYKTHKVDIDLLRELRETEKQIAIETGEWVEKRDDVHRVTTIKDLSDEVLGELIAKAEIAAAEQAQLPPGSSSNPVEDQRQRKNEVVNLTDDDDSSFGEQSS